MAAEKIKIAKQVLVFRSGCTNVAGFASEIRLRLGKTQNKFWFFARLALILQ
jgi:hypothetical protein